MSSYFHSLTLLFVLSPDCPQVFWAIESWTEKLFYLMDLSRGTGNKLPGLEQKLGKSGILSLSFQGLSLHLLEAILISHLRKLDQAEALAPGPPDQWAQKPRERNILYSTLLLRTQWHSSSCSTALPTALSLSPTTAQWHICCQWGAWTPEQE